MMNSFFSFFPIFKNNYFVWQDFVEITFFSVTIYFVILLLSADKNKNLVRYFYTFSFLLIIARLLDLSTIESFLWSFLPVIAISFILIHQKTLQANFVGLARIITDSGPNEYWYAEVIRTCKKTIDEKRQLVFIIEKKDSLSGLLKPCYTMQAAVQSNLLSFLLSCSKNPIVYIWLDHKGYIKGIGTNEEQLLNLFETIKHTDALLLYALNHLSFYLAEEKYEQLSTTHALQMLQKYLKVDTEGPKYNENKKPFHQSQL